MARRKAKSGKKKKPLDDCAKLAKRRYKKWPSAYASGHAVQCRKAGGVAAFTKKKRKK
jgi:hypothetical protein|tara:strand:- start:2523 stop:2696 length:174 start_codon:yes stop_codon:yes gene_type:complete